MKSVNWVFGFLLLATLMTPMPTVAQEPVPCELEYFVQPGDSLLRIAERYYGDRTVYPSIVQATNDQAAIDSAYAKIDNPSIIRTGWKLCLPAIGGKTPQLAGTDLSLGTSSNGQLPPDSSKAVIPAATASASEVKSVRSEDGFTPEDITFRAQTLTNNVTGVIRPAKPYDTSSPPGPTGNPDYVAFLLQQEERLRIFPMKAYEELWNSAGDPTVSNNISQLRVALANRPKLPENPLPFLPPAAAYNDLAVQTQFIDFANGSGLRFIGRFSPDVSPVVNADLKYIFQGLTHDGNYYVSFEYPVSTSVLPNEQADVSPEEKLEARENFQDYLAGLQEQLNGLSPAAFTPDLARLDALVESLEITQPPEAQAQSGALVGTTWKLLEIQEMSDNTIAIDDPEKYTLELRLDGAAAIRADCNYGRGGYEAQGQQLSMEINALTKAMCPLDSLSETYIRLLNEATSYVIRDGSLFISYGPDGGVMKFTQ